MVIDPALLKVINQEEKASEAMDRAGKLMQEALEAFGDAGRLTYEEQLPAIREKTQKSLHELKNLLQELELRLREDAEKNPSMMAPEPLEKKAPVGGYI
ncbi:MAG: hypothetical protein H7832_02660 [Magnetococcus sp. DMHC-6]